MFSVYNPPPTMEEYRSDYPNHELNNRSMNTNLKFYLNEIPSRPHGDKIDRIHKIWSNDYDLLESHHGYIQWIFPLKEESRFNHESAVMQRHEAMAIQHNPKCLTRMVASLRMMLNFWGATLSPKDPDPVPRIAYVSRCGEWYERFWNLRRHGHNNMRISRMLKCLGEVGLEHYKMPIIKFFILNIYGDTAPLAGSGCANSCKRYWVKTLRCDEERASMEALIRTLESADWVYQEDLSMLQNNIYDVGRRVAVYWKRDQKYHHGRIIALRQKADQMAIRYTVLYDNGELKIDNYSCP
eukprot:g2855.t1